MLQFKKYIDKMYILFIKSVLFRKFSVKAYLSECFGVSDHLSATKFILASSEQSITWLSVWNLSQNVLIILQQVPFIEIKYESNLIALYISKFRVLLNHLDIACSSINMSLLSTAGDLHITREKTMSIDHIPQILFLTLKISRLFDSEIGHLTLSHSQERFQ